MYYKTFFAFLVALMSVLAGCEKEDIRVVSSFHPKYIEENMAGFRSISYDKYEKVVYAGLTGNTETSHEIVPPIVKWNPYSNEHFEFQVGDLEISKVFSVRAISPGCEKEILISSFDGGTPWEYLVKWDSKRGLPLKTAKTRSINAL